MKVFLHGRESRHPYQIICRLEQVCPIRTERFYCVKTLQTLHSVLIINVCVTSPDVAHPEIHEILVARGFFGKFCRINRRLPLF